MASPRRESRRDQILGVVLTGGASRRMGRDKATLDVLGRPLVDRAVRALRGVDIETVVAVGGEGEHISSASDVAWIADQWPGEGPLGGIVSAARWAINAEPKYSDLVVLACDLPFVSSEAICGLLNETKRDGTMGHDGVRPQPLAIRLRIHTVPHITRAFNAGERSPRKVWNTLEIGVASPVGHDGWSDVDTPEQLATAIDRLRATEG